MNKRHVIIFVDTKAISGPAKGILQLIKSTTDDNIQYIICTFRYKKVDSAFIATLKAESISHFVIEGKYRFDPFTLHKVYKFLSQFDKSTIIQTHGYKTNLLGMIFSRVFKFVWLSVHHGWTSENLKTKTYQLIDRLTMGLPNAEVAVSRKIYDYLYLHRSDQVHYIPNAISPSDSEALSINENIRLKFNLSPEIKIALCIGRFSAEKGQSRLIRMFKKIAAENWVLLLIGNGIDFSNLKNQAGEHFEKSIFFLSHAKNTVDYYRQSDLLVIPSYSEGLPNVLLEALCENLPTVSTSVGDIPNVMRDGIDGYLVESEDEFNFESKLQELFQKKEKLREYFPNVGSALFPEFSVKKRCSRFLEIYQHLEYQERNISAFLIKKLRFIAKELFATIYIQLSKLKRLIFKSNHVTILTYHRVSDQYRDAVTVGVTQFIDQLRILKRKAKVVDLQTYLNGGCSSRSNKPYVILTFDDAYKDNYEVVAPALEKFGFHGTFFVSTGYIENQNILPFDSRTIGRRIDLMSWNEISDLKSRGFGIGAHTVNHINCGIATTNQLEQELKECALVLKQQLDIENLAFAYPFGGRRHINPAMYSLLEKYNYSAALSNYGGANSLIVDKYEIKRYGVDYRFSEKAFMARVEGLPFSGR